MEPTAALAKLRAYRQQLKRRVDEEYDAAVIGYEALAAGTRLLDLRQAFGAAGFHPDGRPKLAIARADRPQVMVRVERSSLQFNALADPLRWGYRGSLVINVGVSRITNDGSLAGTMASSIVEVLLKSRGWALVPMVPADVRPKGDLRDFFVLWEVEQWADRALSSDPDRDPYLLRHIMGDLYAVVAEWDLTDLERAIMVGRRVGR
jgi:hypothetical protein